MNNKTSSIIFMEMVICLLLFCFMDLHAFADESKIGKAAIEKAWKAKQDRIKTARLVWKCEETRPRLDETGLPSTEKQQAELFIDRGKISLRRKVSEPLQTRIGAMPIKEQKVVFDGKQASELIEVMGHLKGSGQSGTIYATATFPAKNNLICIPVLLGLRPMDPHGGNIDMKKSTLHASRKSIGAKSCLVLDVHEKGTSLVYRYWIDPDTDFSILRFQNVLEGNLKDTDLITVDISYSKVNKEWLPAEWKYTCYNLDAKKICSGKSVLTKHKVNVSVDPRVFTLVFPQNVPVYDEKEDKMVP